jgi:hypothetical protein
MIVERVVVKRMMLIGPVMDDAFKEAGAVNEEQCTSKQLRHLQSFERAS